MALYEIQTDKLSPVPTTSDGDLKGYDKARALDPVDKLAWVQFSQLRNLPVVRIASRSDSPSPVDLCKSGAPC